MIDRLNEILKGKVVIVGVGNPLRGDDGFGPELIKELKGHVKAVCIDAGSVPENYTGKIAKEYPDTILIVDAVHLDREPGEFAILEKSEIMKSGLTTHDISPRLFIEFLENQTRADIYMLGVQPENLSIGDGMSDKVKKTLSYLEGLMKGILRSERKMMPDYYD